MHQAKKVSVDPAYGFRIAPASLRYDDTAASTLVCLMLRGGRDNAGTSQPALLKPFEFVDVFQQTHGFFSSELYA